jgi:hypothetical protein
MTDWEILPPIDAGGVRIVRGRWMVAQVYGGNRDERARLIRAAPALRDAAQALSKALDESTIDVYPYTETEALRAVLESIR